MGEYDWIMDQRETYGDEYVDKLIDQGYVPIYVTELGWRWSITSISRENISRLGVDIR